MRSPRAFSGLVAKHEALIIGAVPTFGSSKEDIDRAAIYKTFEDNLVRLGLLRLRFYKGGKKEPPEFDYRTGTLKSSGLEITRLGRLLLKSLDLE